MNQSFFKFLLIKTGESTKNTELSFKIETIHRDNEDSYFWGGKGSFSFHILTSGSTLFVSPKCIVQKFTIYPPRISLTLGHCQL